MRPVYGRLSFPMTVVELRTGDCVSHRGYSVAAFAVRHRGAALGYALVEDERPGRFDAELAERLGVLPGPDFGRLQRGETVAGVSPEQVIGPSRTGRKVVFSGDTAPCEAVVVAAHQADLLVHEATFGEDEAERARQTEHTTARQAAQLALEADVRLLALTHLSTRYAGGELREEARSVFAATEVPRDFDTIEVPLPEKGPPALHRWVGEQRAVPAAGSAVA
jgi:ribonuclease Z